MTGGTAKARFCQPANAAYGWSVSTMSKAGMGRGKCMEFQNQRRFSSASLRCSSKSDQYGYMSSQPSHPFGVSIENGLGNAPTSDVAVAICLSSSVPVAREKVKSIGLFRDPA